jgi:polysaccharide chain length determinant protein (PEP-CTERM system associated)
MDKILADLRRHLRAMWRYRWHGLISAWAVALLGAVVVMMIPKKYEASARIFVNTDSILKPLMAGMAVQPNIDQRIAMFSRLLLSRPNVEQLIDQSGMGARLTTPEQRQTMIDDVLKVLEIQAAGERDNVYLIKFRDTEAARAKRVVELLVARFIDSSRRNRGADDAARKFIDTQAALYENRLRDMEARLKRFKLHNMAGGKDSFQPDGKGYFAQMATLAEQLSQAQLQLREAERSRDAYRGSLAAEFGAASSASVNGAAGGGSLPEITGRIDIVKRSLDDMLQKYTEAHPDVKGARRVLATLERQRRAAQAEVRRSGIAPAATGQAGMRASEQIKVSLAQTEASIASLQARVAEYASRLTDLREVARQVPEREAELAQLSRDYDINKKNYEELVTRRESANISGDMQAVAGVADVRLIDPPRVAPSMKGPSRTLLLAATLLLGAGVGLVVSFLLKELHPRVHDTIELQETFGIPVLGVISRVANPQTEREQRRGMVRFAQMAAVLAGIYLGVLAAGVMLTRQMA